MTPIRDVVNRILARVLDARRRREEFDEAELVARFPVSDPDGGPRSGPECRAREADEAVAREFTEPEIGG